ncbi:signal recognition particle-docking protein FtsY [Candidatus Poribacteria bacterium]|nr:signal recognition particle-docking protein FtsY [Candidatus Poribacteria bacterium]
MLRNIFRQRKRQEEKEPEEPEVVQEPESLVEEAALIKVEETAEPELQKVGWFQRLKTGLSKTRKNLTGRISTLISSKRKIDDELLEEIEEILIQADVGVNTTLNLMNRIREIVREQGMEDSSELEEILKSEMLKILGEEEYAINVDKYRPSVIMVLGVNGVGKTTTIGKLAARYRRQGKRVLVAAGDTFRAAGVDQLDIWCNRAGVELIKGNQGSDPAAVVFDSIHAAQARKADVLIVDTAGRLHTKKPLMEELAKIGRVMKRELPGSPHEVLLVLDATTGQNAITQAKMFNEAVPITGIALTKLDGTAKGGIVIAIKDELGVPVKLIGIGQAIDDLRDFSAKDFVEALFAEGQ